VGNGRTTSISNVCSILETTAPPVKSPFCPSLDTPGFGPARACSNNKDDDQEVGIGIDTGNSQGRARARPLSHTGVGILAYGSLLTWPGAELHGLIEKRIDKIRTPFSVEFARAAARRSGAPTLAPVDEGGCRVDGSLLILDADVELEDAYHLLYRREINQVGTELTYDPNEPPSPDRVHIEQLTDFEDCRHVLFAKLPALLEPDPVDLARRAIASASAASGAEGRDGISYLMGVRSNRIETPLTPAYIEEILNQTGTSNLSEALAAARASATT
jgi:hypothetical protein